MVSLNTDPNFLATTLGTLQNLDTDQYVLAFGPDGRQFFATPNGYAATYLPSSTLAEVANPFVKKVVWASFGDATNSWFFAYQFEAGQCTVRLGLQAPHILRDYVNKFANTSEPLLGSLRVQFGSNKSFVAWSQSSWACHNVPEKLRVTLIKWSSGTRTSQGMTMGQLNGSTIINVTWHQDGSYFIRTKSNLVSWAFCTKGIRAAWDMLWTDVGLIGPGPDEIADLACVAINPHAPDCDTFAFIKKHKAGEDASFVVHFSDEPLHARLSQTDQRLQVATAKSDEPFRWAVSMKTGRPHGVRDEWELELKKGQRVRVTKEMSNDWFLVVGKKDTQGWVHGSWLDFSEVCSHEQPAAAWDRFSADVATMLESSPGKSFPSMVDYVDVCTRKECMLGKDDGLSLGICAHDLEELLRGSGSYSAEWLKKERNQWHPDRFARFCSPELAARAEQLFVLYSILADCEASK